MKISLLCIGNELLNGKTINTNAAWIGKQISQLGSEIIEQAVVPDIELSIINKLNEMVNEKPSCIIITGGLGPTDDDVTRSSLFKFVNTSENFDSNYWSILSKKFKNLGFDIPNSNRSQAMVPEKGQVIDNPLGSARGFKFEVDSTTIISLPGVPNEMKKMMNETILPWIQDNEESSFFTVRLRTTGIPESQLIEILEKPINSDHGCSLGYYPSVYGVDLQISSYKESSVITFKNTICDYLKGKIYTENDENIENVVIREAVHNKSTIAIAESCTGGLVGSRITDVPGSSRVFLGGIIAYSNEIKEKSLGVKGATLKRYGAVSEETAIEMANCIRNKFSSEIGLSVTGIAGPDGGTVEKPIGLVYIGFSNKFGDKVFKRNFISSRGINKKRASQAALDILRMELINNE